MATRGVPVPFQARQERPPTGEVHAPGSRQASQQLPQHHTGPPTTDSDSDIRQVGYGIPPHVVHDPLQKTVQQLVPAAGGPAAFDRPVPMIMPHQPAMFAPQFYVQAQQFPAAQVSSSQMQLQPLQQGFLHRLAPPIVPQGATYPLQHQQPPPQQQQQQQGPTNLQVQGPIPLAQSGIAWPAPPLSLSSMDYQPARGTAPAHLPPSSGAAVSVPVAGSLPSNPFTQHVLMAAQALPAPADGVADGSLARTTITAAMLPDAGQPQSQPGPEAGHRTAAQAISSRHSVTPLATLPTAASAPAVS